MNNKQREVSLKGTSIRGDKFEKNKETRNENSTVRNGFLRVERNKNMYWKSRDELSLKRNIKEGTDKGRLRTRL